MHDKNSPLTQTIKAEPEKVFDSTFTPKQTHHNWCEVPEGERACDGLWNECIFPVYPDGSSHHITETVIKNGKVVYAFSNMFNGITFAPGKTVTTYGNRWGFGSETYCPWDQISHFEDPNGNCYEKGETQ